MAQCCCAPAPIQVISCQWEGPMIVSMRVLNVQCFAQKGWSSSDVFSLSVAMEDYIIPLYQYLVLGLFSNCGNKTRGILLYLYYLKNFPGCNVVAGH